MRKHRSIHGLGGCELGEELRAIAFVGPGYGAYENFDARPDARQWSEEEVRAFVEKYRQKLVIDECLDPKDPEWVACNTDWIVRIATGFSFSEEGLDIDCLWCSDGDVTLVFVMRKGERIIRGVVNRDAKKDYTWERLFPKTKVRSS